MFFLLRYKTQVEKTNAVLHLQQVQAISVIKSQKPLKVQPQSNIA